MLFVLVVIAYHFKNIDTHTAILKEQSVNTMILLESKAIGAHNCAISILQQTEDDLARFRRMEADFVHKHKREPWFRKFYWGK